MKQLFAELERQAGLRVVCGMSEEEIVEVEERPTVASILQSIAARRGGSWIMEGETVVIGGPLRQSPLQEERRRKRMARRERLINFLESLPEVIRGRVEVGQPLSGQDVRALPLESQRRLQELLMADLGGYKEATHLADNDTVTVILCPQVLFFREGQGIPRDAVRVLPKAYFQDVCKP